MGSANQLSAWIAIIGGIGWAAVGVVALTGRLRLLPPRAWTRAGPRWSWCQVFVGIGLACFPTDVVAGTLPELSVVGTLLIVTGLGVLLTGSSSPHTANDENPPGVTAPTHPSLPRPQPGYVSPEAPTHPDLPRPPVPPSTPPRRF
jgi:hypothetical protein